jgi:hypothetical protein
VSNNLALALALVALAATLAAAVARPPWLSEAVVAVVVAGALVAIGAMSSPSSAPGRAYGAGGTGCFDAHALVDDAGGHLRCALSTVADGGPATNSVVGGRMAVTTRYVADQDVLAAARVAVR